MHLVADPVVVPVVVPAVVPVVVPAVALEMVLVVVPGMVPAVVPVVLVEVHLEVPIAAMIPATMVVLVAAVRVRPAPRQVTMIPRRIRHCPARHKQMGSSSTGCKLRPVGLLIHGLLDCESFWPRWSGFC